MQIGSVSNLFSKSKFHFKVKNRPVMVGGVIIDPSAALRTGPTSTSEPDVRISPHPAPEYKGCCHTAPAVGAGVSATTTNLPFVAA